MADEVKEVKKVKVGRMNLDQLNQALEKTAKSMGGYQSRYAKALSGRRDLAVAAGKIAEKKA